jgi:hypothetical protein|tara:strand:- start:230 stop:1180 length:951 start_codon:yes stop_codon:yes gene_type:complete
MAFLNGIDTAFVNQYGKTLDLVAETKGGKFTGMSLEDTVTGEDAYYDQLGSVYATAVVDSGSDTDSPSDSISHLRRKLDLTNYEVGLLLDRFDKVQTLINPESEYVMRQVSSLMRKKDIEFIKGALGTASTGKAGAGSADLAAGNKILQANAGLTINKIREARAILQKNGVDLDDPLNEAYLAVTPTQIEDLLGNTEATSADFMNVKALVSGGIDTFYGFKIVVSNLLPFVATDTNVANLTWSASDVPAVSSTDDNVRANFAWVKSGIRTGVGINIETDVAKRADKRFNYYAYSAMRCGSVRMEEDKVVQIQVSEA